MLEWRSYMQVIRRARRTIAVTAIALCGIGISALPAGAAGAPSLDQHIVSQTVPGWSKVASSFMQTYVGYINGLEKAAIGPQGGTAITAAEGWHAPSNVHDTVLITLVAFSASGLSESQIAGQARVGAESAGQSFCTGATGSPAKSDTPLSSIPNSHVIVCKSVGGVTPVAVVWSKANVLALIETTDRSVVGPRLVQISNNEYRDMSSAATSTSTSNVGLIAGLAAVGVVVVAAAITIPLVVSSRRRKAAAAAAAAAVPTPAGSPPAGWYPDPIDPSRGRYWNGVAWGPSGAEAPQGAVVTSALTATYEPPALEATDAPSQESWSASELAALTDPAPPPPPPPTPPAEDGA
jgi:uncharacterized protein DUF2510